MAISSAKSSALNAKKKAAEAKALLKVPELGLELELKKKQALLAIQEERSLFSSKSWKMQVKTVTELSAQVTKYEAQCAKHKVETIAIAARVKEAEKK